MIDKKTFTKVINKLKLYQENETAIYKAGVDLTEFSEPLIDTIFELLKYSTNDETELISYFCYELNFGKDWYEGCVCDEDNTDIRLQDIEDLYNVLVTDEERRANKSKS